MKIAILYYSKYGSTKQYALWLGEQISADIFHIKYISTDKLNEYDCFIIGDSITYSQLHILSFLKKNKSILESKHIFFYICGLYDNHKYKKDIYHIMKKEYPIYFLQGYFDYEKLTLFDKFQIQLTKKIDKRNLFLSNLNNNYLFQKDNCNDLLKQIKTLILKQ